MTKNLTKPLVYLACPYSHPDAVVREIRFKQASIASGKILGKGEIIFSPITHFHPIAEQYKLPTDWPFWEKVCRTYLSVCHKVYVLMIPGWEESVGVTEELKIAKELGLDVEFITI